MAGVQHREPIHLAFLRGCTPLRPCRHARLLRVKWPCPSAPDALRRARGMVQKLPGDSARKRASTQEPCIQGKRWDHVLGGSVTAASALLLGAPGSSPAPEATLERGDPRDN